jgi:hypothetical protein
VKLIIIVAMFFSLTTYAQAADKTTAVYDSEVLTEDTTWRGSVLVRGFVSVAPQATLRIEPGTVVRFMATSTNQSPNLIIHGRLQASGTSESPIILTSALVPPVKGSWGGIVFLSTEKRNLLERCRIEFAETGIDVRFSTIYLKSISIVQSQTALLSHDGVVQISNGVISDSENGLEIYDSELEAKDLTILSCQRGCILSKSSAALVSLRIQNNQKTGLDATDCRLKISGGEFSANASGARITGGEGQIVTSSFERNRQTSLHLLGTRIKVLRCLFDKNTQDALRVEDGRSLLLNNVFSVNGGYNIYNSGSEVINARQNWWGTTDQSVIKHKIYDAVLDKNSGAVQIFPWLNEKPLLLPMM